MKKLILILSIIILASCSSVKQNKITMGSKEKDKVILNFKAGPQTIIYKTSKNYNKLVPVILSDDKTKIVSYPHPKDIYLNGNFSYPTELQKGYLLDNRGINKNVAFLKITYEEYSNYKNAPSPNELYEKILDKDPLIEIYNCGNRLTFKNEIEDLNRLIESDGLELCECFTK